MPERLKTLVLDANGFSWKEVGADTLVLGVLRAPSYDVVPERLRHLRGFRALRYRYDRLGYVGDWRDALCESPSLEVRVCNITNLVDFASCLRRIRDFDLVIVLHSAAGDSMTPLRHGARRLRGRRGKLVVFVGNEYDLMDEKLAFLRATRADYVCSQLPAESARWLYDGCGAEVLPLPHALNPALYRPAPPERPVDIGFVGPRYPLFVGDVERTRLIDAVRSRAPRRGLVCDIREQTVPRTEWASFLARSTGTVGAESGTYFLDRRGAILSRAKAFVAAHRAARFEELHERFFATPGVDYVSGKCISSRHFEAIGTKTCQILVEGSYNGILRPEQHYIGVRKDLSDLDAALTRFEDDAYRREIADRAYAYVLDEHTYSHRVRALLEAIGAT